MLGCHNCQQKPKPGTPYEKTPCAKCKTMEQPPPISHFRDDPGTYQRLNDDFKPENFDAESGAAVSADQMQALAAAVLKLVELKEKKPITWQILMLKMQKPFYSYSEIGKQTKTTKQNVQYHLKMACRIFPELSAAILIDQRCTAKSKDFDKGI